MSARSDESPSGFGGDTLPAKNEAVEDEAGPPKPGSIIGGKYRVEGVIGRGGMGVVLAAEHVGLGRPVAIKLLNRSTDTSSEAVERFLREGRAAAQLQSRHVVRVFDVGTLSDGAAHVVMERLEGADLAAVLREEGPLPVEVAADYVLQACAGLAEAHDRGIVHRDLKPSNLFLTRDRGEPLVKLLDFGVAKLVDATERETSLTASSGLLGSPAYMAPEQIRAARNVDARADVWSLGVVLFELVTGSLPFAGTTASAVLASIAADPPIRLRSRRADAPGALERVISRCLEKDRDKRPRNAADLAAALAQFSRRPADWTLASVTKVESRRGRPSVAFVLIGLLAVLALGGALFGRREAAPTLHAGAGPVATRIARTIKTFDARAQSPMTPSSPPVAPALAKTASPQKPSARRGAAPAKLRRDIDTATAERK
jgi:eukaryotic-like serine/threonine-protein kinase